MSAPPTVSKAAPTEEGEAACERIEIDVTPSVMRMLQAAATLKGLSVSDFVRQAARDRAESVLEPREVWELTPEQTLAFVENCLDSPPPTPEMRANYQRYLELGGRPYIGEGRTDEIPDQPTEPDQP